MGLIVSPSIEEKLNKKKPPVSIKEVEQCFINRVGGLLEDTREEHKTTPATFWFVAPTNQNRALKIMYVQDGGEIYLKSAYDATKDIIRIYNKYAF
jgi:hypothetical protein